MPHISLTLYKGRKSEELERMAKTLQQALKENEKWKDEDISVSICEETPDTFVPFTKEKIKDETLVIPSSCIN